MSGELPDAKLPVVASCRAASNQKRRETLDSELS